MQETDDEYLVFEVLSENIPTFNTLVVLHTAELCRTFELWSSSRVGLLSSDLKPSTDLY